VDFKTIHIGHRYLPPKLESERWVEAIDDESKQSCVRRNRDRPSTMAHQQLIQRKSRSLLGRLIGFAARMDETKVVPSGAHSTQEDRIGKRPVA